MRAQSWLRRLGLLTLAVLAISPVACSSGSSGLDSARVTRALTVQTRRAYPGITIGKARCPRRVTLPITCTVELDGTPLRVRVTKNHHNRKLKFQVSMAVLTNAALQYFLQAHLSLPATIDCGPKPVQVVEPGGELRCNVAFADGSQQSVGLRVMDVAGTVSIEPTS
jgi:prepilin-type processing-associated H-X9-DG protein